MKKIVLILGICVLIFVGLTYWSTSSTDKNFGMCEIIGFDDITKINFRDYDSVLVAANTLYEGNEIKNIMQGEQYRNAWATPVKVPIVFLDTLMGGMKILEEGGGKQTHSLKVQASDSTIYTLRSISKDPEPLIPEIAKQLGLENIIVDGVSAQHPYAALVVAELAKKAKILSTRPRVVFVPTQPLLDTLNAKYGNRLFLLEYETEGKATWTGYRNVAEIIDTEALQQFKVEHPGKISIDKSALVRARLFDLLIGDWDRHAKQWGWVVQNNGDAFFALPLPCDRDNAFFNIEGIVPTLISNKNFLPKVQQFKDDIDYMPGLVNPFDIYFLKEVPELTFLEEAKALQWLMNDQAIADSFKVWPQTIFELDGAEIINKLKSRRQHLPEYAKRLHEILKQEDLLTEPLKGSEDLKLSKERLACFDCLEEVSDR